MHVAAHLQNVLIFLHRGCAETPLKQMAMSIVLKSSWSLSSSIKLERDFSIDQLQSGVERLAGFGSEAAQDRRLAFLQ